MNDPKNKIYSFEELLKEKGYLVYTNVGSSMLPLLRARRDIIEVHAIDGRIQKYQVALYKRNGNYILHRCIVSNSSGYVFAGDNNIFKEYDVTDDMILGVMTRVIRNGKSIYMDNPWYKLYSHLWVDFFPIKVLILRIKNSLGRLKRGMSKNTRQL